MHRTTLFKCLPINGRARRTNNGPSMAIGPPRGYLTRTYYRAQPFLHQENIDFTYSALLTLERAYCNLMTLLSLVKPKVPKPDHA